MISMRRLGAAEDDIARLIALTQQADGPAMDRLESIIQRGVAVLLGRSLPREDAVYDARPIAAYLIHRVQEGSITTEPELTYWARDAVLAARANAPDCEPTPVLQTVREVPGRFAALPPRHQEALRLYYVEHATPARICQRFHLSEEEFIQIKTAARESVLADARRNTSAGGHSAVIRFDRIKDVLHTILHWTSR